MRVRKGNAHHGIARNVGFHSKRAHQHFEALDDLALGGVGIAVGDDDGVAVPAEDDVAPVAIILRPDGAHVLDGAVQRSRGQGRSLRGGRIIGGPNPLAAAGIGLVLRGHERSDHRGNDHGHAQSPHAENDLALPFIVRRGRRHIVGIHLVGIVDHPARSFVDLIHVFVVVVRVHGHRLGHVRFYDGIVRVDGIVGVITTLIAHPAVIDRGRIRGGGVVVATISTIISIGSVVRIPASRGGVFVFFRNVADGRQPRSGRLVNPRSRNRLGPPRSRAAAGTAAPPRFRRKRIGRLLLVVVVVVAEHGTREIIIVIDSHTQLSFYHSPKDRVYYISESVMKATTSIQG